MRFQAQSGWFDEDRAFNTLVFLGFKQQGAAAWYGHLFSLVIYGIPMVFCFFFATRPARFGIAVMSLLLVNMVFIPERGGETVIAQERTYFGVLRVSEKGESILTRDQTTGKAKPRDEEEFMHLIMPNGEKGEKNEKYEYKYTQLLHGTTHHGMNFKAEKDAGDLSRLATTYYHRYGPVGLVMEKFNWLPGWQNSYWADARMPATMVGNAVAGFGTSPLPYADLVNVWSEPPYATIGLGTGTMASYARPYQHMVYYEIDEQIRNFSLPPPGEKAAFTYLLGAINRGANLEVIMGDARLSMKNEDPRFAFYPEVPDDGRFVDKISGSTPAIKTSTMFQGRDKYYKVIVVDAFSSDAIPVHLITKEAIQLYMSKLTFDGVLCVHTSNRHLDLVQPVARIVDDLDEEYFQKDKRHVRCLIGKDEGRRNRFLGHFGSEYVMIYFSPENAGGRDDLYLKPAKDYVPPQYNIYENRAAVHWSAPDRKARHPWTDDFSNIISILR